MRYAPGRKQFGHADRRVPGASSSRSRTWRRRSRRRACSTWRAASIARLRPGAHRRVVDGEALRERDRRCEVALEAVQIHGGYGYIKEYPVERYLRDSQARHHRRGHERGAAARDRARAARPARGGAIVGPEGPSRTRSRRSPTACSAARSARIARAISLVEDDAPRGGGRSCPLSSRTPAAPLVVGVTGPPGAGKSTLVDRMTAHLREAGPDRRDRRRRPDVALHRRRDPRRSHPHAGARHWTPASSSARWPRAATWAASPRPPAHVLTVLAASGKDVILVETVGVGQDEVEIVGRRRRERRGAGAGPRRRGAGAQGRASWRSPTSSW